MKIVEFQCLILAMAGVAGSLGIEVNEIENNKGHLRSNYHRNLRSRFCTLFPSFCSEECPDVEPLNSEEFDIDTYIEKSWYVQKQQLNPYQDEEDLFCVAVSYDIRSDGYVQVYNYQNNNAVNGPASGTSQDGGLDLCAEELDAGKLQVAPCFFNRVPFGFDIGAGPYWVVAVSDPGTDNYRWAIITGGKPDQVKQTDPTLCTTSNGPTYIDAIFGSGLWLFTRDPIADDDTIQEMMDALNDLGIYAGELKDVAQEGCEYDGAYIKS